MNQQQMQEPPQKNIKRWSIITLGVLLAGSLSTNFFYLNSNKELQQNYDREVLRTDSLLSVKLMVDKQLDDTQATLDQHQVENASVKNILASANEELKQQKATVDRLYKENASLETLSNQLTNTQKLNSTLQKRIQEVLAENELSKKEALQLKMAIAQLDSLSKVKPQPEKAETTIQLQANAIEIKPLRKQWSGKYKATDKAFKTDRLAISVELSSPTPASACDRSVYLVITDPNNRILSEGSSRSFITKEGKQSKYTWARQFDCQHKSQQLSFNWNQEKKFVAGVYTAEVYCNGQVIGKSQVFLN